MLNIFFLITFWLNNFNIELNEDSTKLFNKTFNQIASIFIENMFYSGYFNPKDNKKLFCYVLNNERAGLVKYYLDKKEIDMSYTCKTSPYFGASTYYEEVDTILYMILDGKNADLVIELLDKKALELDLQKYYNCILNKKYKTPEKIDYYSKQPFFRNEEEYNFIECSWASYEEDCVFEITASLQQIYDIAIKSKNPKFINYVIEKFNDIFLYNLKEVKKEYCLFNYLLAFLSEKNYNSSDLLLKKFGKKNVIQNTDYFNINLFDYNLDKKEIDYLIENGFDFNKKDKDGYYILDYFKLRNNKYNYPDKYNHIIEYLRSKNFNENIDK